MLELQREWCFHYLLAYWQNNTDLSWVDKLKNAPMDKIQKIFYDKGYQFNVEHVSSTHLMHQLCPVMLRLIKDEYVILKSINSNEVCLIYPISGNVKMTWLEFECVYSGEQISIVKATMMLNKGLLSHQMIKDVLKKLATLGWLGWGILSILVAYEIFSLIEPVLLNVVVEHLDLFGSQWELLGMLFGIGGLIIFGLGIGLFRQKIWIGIFGKLSAHLSDELMRGFLALSLKQSTALTVNEYHSRLYATEQVCYRYLQQIFFGAMDVLFLVIHFCMMCFYHWGLAMLDLGFLVCMGVMNYCLSKHYYHASISVLEKQTKSSGLLLECLKYLSVIKLYRIESIIFSRWQQSKQSYWDEFIKNDGFQSILEWGLLVLKKLNWLLTLGLAIFWVITLKFSLGALIAYLSLKTLVFSRFESGLKRMMQWQYLKAPLDRISAIFAQQEPSNPNTYLKNPVHHIDVIGLHINGQKLVDFGFSQHRKYILIGSSGCGKSTLLKMIMGVVPVQAGGIFYQGKSCALDNGQSIQQDCVMVSQDEGLFAATLLENICLFANDVDRILLNEVSQFVDLAQCGLALSTMVGAGGHQLSAGEQQRVLIARALYRRPAFLILDEATCHLDAEAEKKIMTNLLASSISMIVVNHRRNYDRHFDEVLEWTQLTSI